MSQPASDCTPDRAQTPWVLAVRRPGQLGGFSGSPEPGDRFGQVLSTTYRLFDGNETVASVFVGVPQEDVGTARDAGIVVQITHNIDDVSHSSRTWTQNSPGMPGVAESGDQLGAAVAEWENGPFFGSAAFGAPGEDIGSSRDAGLVTFLDAGFVGEFGETGQYWPGYAISQDSPGVPGAAESGDRFGASLATAGYRCRVDARGGYAIGAPGEDLGGLADAGAVVLFDSGYNGTEGDQAGPRDATCSSVSVRQGSGAHGVAEAGDQFGKQIATTRSGGLAISTPGEDWQGKTDAGAVHCLRLRPIGSINVVTLSSGAQPGISYAALWLN
jgi:hypothetical protein